MNDLVIVFGAVLVLFFLELVLAMKWYPFYFEEGLPIFWRRVDRPAGLADVDLEALQKSCATVAATPVEFRRFPSGMIAFREKAFGGSIHYFPIMHGAIRHRAEESSVVVFGLVKWWVILLVAIFVWYLRANVIDVLPYLGVALAVLYLIQAVRYARIAKALRVG